MNQFKTWLIRLNKLGIPLPVLTDPKTGQGSVSLTMLFVSFNMVLIALVGKWSKQLNIDVQQTIYWFMVCAGLYFGRRVTGDGKKADLSKED